ncbi:hypothetical protein PENTCL1PPCAC_27942 [Pristionchus entomophagus]|uniref:Uncharacterized protein n=1 Tax=Pristionchus entomophagus TaxID=358040 RepID=A0AAV5UHH0_9BILA|nr:hypothetical protein PENTCL1PPCAC_27942 [Pristionchus entomophagus]
MEISTNSTIISALKAKNNESPNSLSPHSTTSDYDQEMQSNGKPMTVMSYEMWKMKCAQEKKEREARKKENISPVSRKRTYPFGDEGRDLTPSPSTVRGTYVNLPTIPSIRVLVDADKKTILMPDGRGISPTLRIECIPSHHHFCCSSVHSTPSASINTSPSPSSRPRLSSLPLPSSLSSSISTSLPLSSLIPSSFSDHSRPVLSSFHTPTTVIHSLPPTLSSIPSTLSSSDIMYPSFKAFLRLFYSAVVSSITIGSRRVFQ